MTAPELPPIVNNAVSLEQRFARVKSWLRTFDLLLGVIQGDINDKVAVTKDFIHEHGHLAAPILSPDRVSWGLSRHNVTDIRNIGVLALFKSDANLHTAFKYQMDKITYFEQPQTIFLPPSRITPIWRGILAFHEVTHAKNHDKGTYKEVEHGHWVEETEVFRDEFEVLSQLYGPSYDIEVDEVAKQYVADIENGDFSAVPRNSHLSFETIEAIMGRSYSSMERGLRYGAANMDAIYRAFDHLGRTDHSHVTEWIYSQQK